MPNQTVDLTFIIPAFNEEERLPVFLEELKLFLITRDNYEVIVVDDGSTDNTVNAVIQIAKTWPALSLISLSNNYGKGYAVATGVFAANGKLSLFLDADGAYGPSEISAIMDGLTDGSDMAIGSRLSNHPKSNRSIRSILGRSFNLLIRTLGLLPFSDTQCGIKIFNTNIARTLFAKMSCHGFAFDVELLMLARKQELRIREVSITCRLRSGSKVKLWQSSIAMARDVILLYFRIR